MSRASEEVTRRETYPQRAFEALLVVAVDGGQDLQELHDALLVVEVGHLLEGLLDQLTKGLGLRRREEEKKRGSVDAEARCEGAGGGVAPRVPEMKVGDIRGNRNPVAFK